MRFGICGAGFWAQYQLSAWQEIADTQCVAVCDPSEDRARTLAERFGIRSIYTSVEDMLDRESLDFIDVIASPASHEPLVLAAAKHRKPVICQKPMAETEAACRRMVEACTSNQTWFAIHENWRWQSTLRRVKLLVDAGRIGDIYRCRLDFVSGFDVFANQPTLRQCEQFIIADVGCHVLDYARCLFGEADSLYCRTSRVSKEIRGEDVASISMMMNGGKTLVDVNLAYALTPMADECFPETRLFAEGSAGSIELLSRYRLRITDHNGTSEELLSPQLYSWLNPQYAIVHSSLVGCNQHMVDCIRSRRPAETDGRDNLKSMELVFRAYESAQANRVIELK